MPFQNVSNTELREWDKYRKKTKQRNSAIFKYSHGLLPILVKIGRRTEKNFINSMILNEITFRFIPPAATHKGGVWARLIGIVKRIIGKVLHNRHLREERLQTVFFETEDRQLTASDKSIYRSLTPNHFLIGSSNADDG